MLYGDDLVINAESPKELGATYAAWKNYMKSKGLRPNLEKTNMMITDVNQGLNLPLENTHVELLVMLLILTPSFAMIVLPGCISELME